MKKLITYREVTVAVGILVALVIVLTLWIAKPGETVSGFDLTPQPNLPLAAKNMFNTAISFFKL